MAGQDETGGCGKTGGLRLLAIMPRNRYVNATEEEFFEALESCAQVTFYGPGYLPSDDLRDDIRRVYDELGPFDAVLLHQYHYLDSMAAAARECVFRFDAPAFLRSRPGFPGGIDDLPCPVILFLLRMDYYAVDRHMADRIEAHSGYYLSWPAEFVPPKAELQGLERERFAASVTDCYREFAERNRHRLIPMMHVVGDRWFRVPDDGARTRDVAIPGAAYAARIEAARALRRHGVRLGRNVDLLPWLNRGVRLATGRGLHATDWGLDLLQRRFREQIAGSRICYTDGSRLRWPVRKFFEIPALGSALVAEPFANHEMLGFRDGENFVSATADSLPETARALLDDGPRLAALTAAGQAMVRERHGAAVRARQVVGAIDAVVAGRFAGAHWRNGEYQVEMSAPARSAP